MSPLFVGSRPTMIRLLIFRQAVLCGLAHPATHTPWLFMIVQSCRYLAERLVESWESLIGNRQSKIRITPEGEPSPGEVVPTHRMVTEGSGRRVRCGQGLQLTAQHRRIDLLGHRAIGHQRGQVVVTVHRRAEAVEGIRAELAQRLGELRSQAKRLEAQRLQARTMYDIEMIQEVGYCSGIANYARHLAGLPPGARPSTPIDYFPDDFLLFIDESHAVSSTPLPLPTISSV